MVRSGTLFVGLTFTSAHEQDSEPLPKKLPAEAPSGDKVGGLFLRPRDDR